MLKAKFFFRLKALRCVSASSWSLFRESLSLLYKVFHRPLLIYTSPKSVTNLSKLERLHRAASRAISGCLSSSPISLLLSEASLSLSLQRVSLTHLTLASHERALSLPASFPILRLARLRVNPRPYKSSWRAFASTHPLILSPTPPREVGFACASFPPWNQPSLTMESILFSPCSRFDPPLTPQGAALARFNSLPPHDLAIWTYGSVSFPFGKGGSGILANCSLCGSEATLSFSAGPVCSRFPAEACPLCKPSAGLGSTNRPAFLSILLLPDTCSVHATLSYPSSFLLPQSLWQVWHELSSLSYYTTGYNGSLDTRFSRGTTRLMSLPNREALLAPSAIPCSLSPITFRIPLCLFSDWRRTASTKFFDTQVPSISTEELMLPSHVCCNGHSFLLNSYLSRIEGRIENPSCSACDHPSQDTSHLILHCPATDFLRRSLFGDSLSLYDLWSRPWKVARVLGLHGLPLCPHPSERMG